MAKRDLVLTDEELVNLCLEELRQSAGFEWDQYLLAEREQALNYFKGYMPDVPALPNRSRAVSSDVADAIETVLPDLVEIFTGGDDVAAFTPTGPQDEAAAKQETDYINHVVFHENDGFMTVLTFCKDALLSKVGIVKWWWENPAEDELIETFEGKTLEELIAASQDGQVQDLEETAPDQEGSQPTFSFTLRKEKDGQVKIAAVNPDDFTVARDTVKLAKTTYCAHRSRPRAQDLLDDGIDPDIIEQLPPYGPTSDEVLVIARDTAGENLDQRSINGSHDHRTVEVIDHYIRVDADGDGRTELWRIMTGGGSAEGVLIEKERIDDLPFASVTPYVVTHRFYGESLADKLVEVQKIKTALLRMLLDSGYFALNQRMEVAMDRANEWTVSDLLRNEPGVPIRSGQGEAVRPIQAGALTFDVQAALEYISTVAEGRTGVVRNAQGLNPDTLHDTATGALALMSAAQKRVKMIARIFAETGIKDLFLGVHALVRKNATQPKIARLRGQWVPVDPTQWAERNDMTIEVGLGASGQAHELQVMSEALPVIEKIIEMQGGLNGPLITALNAHAILKRMFERGFGFKNADLYLSDPATQPPQQPKPDPKVQEAQANLQMKQAAAQSDSAMAQQKAQADQQLAQQKATADLQLQQQKMEGELALQRWQVEQQIQLQREKQAADLDLARREMELDAQVKMEEARARLQQTVQMPGTPIGGDAVG